MATKPKAILSTHDGREASPITKASNVLFENGQTAQDILNDRQDAMISPVIENSSSMFKVGQGDDVDYSSNVVNGAYEGMVLKGKTMVNYIQEPSSEDVVLPYEFEEGRYVTINDTKESGALGVELKGQTLVNIHDKKTPSLAAAENDWYSNLVIETNSISFTVAKLPENWRYINFKSLNLSMLKPNTKYLVAFEEASGVSTVTFKNGDSTHPLSDTVQIVSNKAIVTTTSDWVNSAQILYIYVPAKNVGAEVKVKNPMIIEYVEGMENWDIPFFTGMTSCKMPILRTIGKNLFDGKFELGSVSMDSGQEVVLNGAVRTSYIKVKPNTTYSLSRSVDTTVGVRTYNKNKKFVKSISLNSNNSTTFTTPNEAEYIRFALIHANNDITVQAQLEEGSNTTSYEAHKSSILSLPEEVVLRSLPNGVCDTFNTRTGVYTQRIGEVVLDGRNYTGFSRDSGLENDTTCKYFISNFFSQLLDGKGGQNEKVVLNCDGLPSVSFNTMQDKTLATYPCIANSGAGSLNLRVKKDLNSTALLLTHLQSNPLRIQYPLATPIVTKINLSSTLKSWNTTTHVYSEIPENTLYPTLSHSNLSYPVILKPSTKYSIVANSYGNSHTNSAINFNLGGATASTTVGSRVTTITTPSTLTSELLTMSGRGNKLSHVMVIEGDVVGDEPYFEGICDCKSPILSNVGANIFDFKTYQPYKASYANGYPYQLGDSIINYLEELENGFVFTTPVSTNHQGACYYVKVKRNTDYYISCDVAFTGTYAVKVLGMYANEIPLTTAIKEGYRHLLNRDNLSANTFQGKFNTRDFDCLFVYLGGAWEETVTKAKTITFTNIQIKELQTPYEPYKSNILSANGDKIELTEEMFEQGTVLWTKPTVGTHLDELKSNVSNRIRLKGVLNAKPNTVYRVVSNDPSDNYWYLPLPLDSNMCKTNYAGNKWIKNGCITTTSDTQYLTFVIKKEGEADIAVSEFSKLSFELSEVDKTIVLRSLPSGVCDTLNVETGEYVQRIGEFVLNGSDDETFVAKGGWDNDTHMSFDFRVSDAVKEKSNAITAISDKFKPVIRNLQSASSTDEFITNTSSGYIFVMIRKNRLNTQDLAGFKQWLSQNPLTVQYELATPVVKTVDLSGYPSSYENGHVILSSGSIEQSLTPKVEYSVATNRNGQIRSNHKMVERHQKQLDQLQAIILANLVNSQYNQTLTTLKYELSRV